MVRPRFVCLALALVTLLVYLPVRWHGFILYDDPDYLTENRVVQAGLTTAGIKWAFTTRQASNWHPVTWLSHMLDCQLFGLDAGAHHLVNVLFHTANAALLLLVLFRFTGALWPSAIVAALFAWHPLRVESVAWAAERKDVLSAFFFLLTLWAYVRYVEARSPGLVGSQWSVVSSSKAGALRPNPKLRTTDYGLRTPEKLRSTLHTSGFYVLAVFFFTLGLMSKPMLVTTPFVLLLLDYWPLKRHQSANPSGGAARPNQKLLTTDYGLRTSLTEKAPFLLLSGISCVMTFLAQRSEAVVGLEPYPVSLRVCNAVVAYGRYLLKTIWPWHLSVVYPLVRRIAPSSLLAAAIVLAGVSLAAWRTRRTRPHLIVGWLWFLGMLVPVIGLVQVGGQSMADRYTYLPQIGLFIALVFEARFWLTRSPRPWMAPSVATAAILAGCLAVTESQLRYWQNSESLFAHAVEVTKDNAIARVNLGVALEQQGRRQEALTQYKAAVALDANLAQAHNNVANLLEQLGRPDEALEHYRAALSLKPNAPLAYDNLGTLLVKLGKFDEGIGHYAKAAELDPKDPRPHYLMAKALGRQGRSTAALLQFQEALRLDENDVPSLVYLARMLASNADASVRDGARAVRLAQRANDLAGDQWLVADTLAMAYAEAGHFDEARESARKALDLCQAAGKNEERPALEERLRLYETNRPYRAAPNL